MRRLPVTIADVDQTLFETLQVMSFEGHHVAAGFCTDMASIPRVVRIVFPRRQIINRPPIFHDWYYATHRLSRRDADRLYYRIMIADGYDQFRATLQFLAVRAFGWYGYQYKSPQKMRENTPELFLKFAKID